MDDVTLLEHCKAVLTDNDRRSHTVPAKGMYPHQWLWDSCFIAMGLRHYNTERAQTELVGLLRGQWANGMIPNIIFSSEAIYAQDRRVWQSSLNPNSPDHYATSGITQPPMLAEAVVGIGKKLSPVERRSWYRRMYPHVLAYHEWLYRERDPHHEGLVLQIHPYETGLDNTPPWVLQLREHHRPWWIILMDVLKLEHVIERFRRDTKHVPKEQRMSNIEAMLYWDVIRRLKRKNHDITKILHRSLFITEDLTFNCILVRANKHLKDIAKTINRTLSEELFENMKLTEKALEGLFDPDSENYYSRDFITHKLITEPTIATFMPLYAGTISEERATQLVQLLKSSDYWTQHPVPSVPKSSPWFSPVCYWQGPTWVNTNWLIIQGLRNYHHDKLADELTTKTIDMVRTSGCYEYFSPLDGQPLGSPDFSWTAALALDLLVSTKAHTKKK